MVKTSDKYSTDTGSRPASSMRLDRLCRLLLVLFLVLTAFEPQKLLFAAVAESTGNDGTSHKCNIEVAQFEPGDAGLTPSFSAAIRENLLNEPTTTKRFNQVLRDDDQRTPEVADILVLKTKIQNYTQGAKTRPSVATLTVPAEIDVRVQLFTRANRLVLDQLVTGEIRLGDKNLRGARKLARNIAAILKTSTLPEPTDLVSARGTSEVQKCQIATITAVQAHELTSSAQNSASSYDVSLRVSNPLYLVLYTPPPGGVDTIQYGVEGEIRVLPGEDKITFTDKLGDSLQAPILNKTTTIAGSNQ
jgi:hypothetical protein